MSTLLLSTRKQTCAPTSRPSTRNVRRHRGSSCGREPDKTAWSFAAFDIDVWTIQCESTFGPSSVPPTPVNMHIRLGMVLSQDHRSTLPYIPAILDFNFCQDPCTLPASIGPYFPTIDRTWDQGVVKSSEWMYSDPSSRAEAAKILVSDPNLVCARPPSRRREPSGIFRRRWRPCRQNTQLAGWRMSGLSCPNLWVQSRLTSLSSLPRRPKSRAGLPKDEDDHVILEDIEAWSRVRSTQRTLGPSQPTRERNNTGRLASPRSRCAQTRILRP